MLKFCDFERAASILRARLNDDFIVLQDIDKLIEKRKLDLVVYFSKPIFLYKCVARDIENDFLPSQETGQTARGRGVGGRAIYQVENSYFLSLFFEDFGEGYKGYYLQGQCDNLNLEVKPIRVTGCGAYKVMAPHSDFRREFVFRLREISNGGSHKYERGDPFILKNDEGIFMLEKPYVGIPQFTSWGVSVESLENYCNQITITWSKLTADEKQECAIQAYQESKAKKIKLEVIAKRLGTNRQTLYEWANKLNKPRAPLEQIVQSLKKSK